MRFIFGLSGDADRKMKLVCFQSISLSHSRSYNTLKCSIVNTWGGKKEAWAANVPVLRRVILHFFNLHFFNCEGQSQKLEGLPLHSKQKVNLKGSSQGEWRQIALWGSLRPCCFLRVREDTGSQNKEWRGTGCEKLLEVLADIFSLHPHQTFIKRTKHVDKCESGSRCDEYMYLQKSIFSIEWDSSWPSDTSQLH